MKVQWVGTKCNEGISRNVNGGAQNCYRGHERVMEGAQFSRYNYCNEGTRGFHVFITKYSWAQESNYKLNDQHSMINAVREWDMIGTCIILISELKFEICTSISLKNCFKNLALGGKQEKNEQTFQLHFKDVCSQESCRILNCGTI